MTYQNGSSRKVHNLPATKPTSEPTPHAAGSYHNPEYHQQLMERLDTYLKNARASVRALRRQLLEESSNDPELP